MSLRSPTATSVVQRRAALVVGGTSGIGAGIAQALARRHYDVTIAGRSEARGRAILDQLQQASSGSSEKGGSSDNSNNSNQHTFIAMNCFDLKSIRSALLNLKNTTTTEAKQQQQQQQPFDVVVFCQGMATLQGYTPTAADGLDEKLQLHYFSRVYASLVLCEHHLLNTSNTNNNNNGSGPRVLTVLSAGVHGKYQHSATDFELRHHYSIKNAADAAGFYTDAGFDSLARQYEGVTFCHAAPGFVATAWGTEMPWLLRRGVIRPLQRMFGKSAVECGETLTEGLLNNPQQVGSDDDDASHKGGGFWLMDERGKRMDPKKNMKHTDAERESIWEKTLALLPDV